MKYILILFLLPQILCAQSEYPQDYFQNPLDITLVLGGSFAELRSNHFHSGLDIKTQQREGLRVYAAAAGYVSRIKVSHFGYGKALYITHPNGYTTVYAHLQKFSPKIEAYVKALQYQKESFEVEMFPSTEELLVEQGEIVAFSGNTGGSGGPHLHYEIRDNAERPINPMLFGIDIKDTSPPYVTKLYAYPKNDSSYINGKNRSTEIRLIPKQNGSYEVETISAYGDIGFGIVSNDKQDLAPNKNGLHNIQTYYNGTKTFEVDFKRFSFDETQHLNRYIDFERYKTDKIRVQKLFLEPNNPLSLFKSIKNYGYVRVEDSTSSLFKIQIRDYKNNLTELKINVEGKKPEVLSSIEAEKKEKTIIYENGTTQLEGLNSTIIFYPNSVYEDTEIDFSFNGDTLKLHKDIVPFQKSFKINYDISKYKGTDKDKLFIANLYGYYKKPSYLNTIRKGDTLSAWTKSLGWFSLASDLTPPTISPVDFQDKKWLSNYRYLKFKIDDDLSGISQYRATVNGKWILMEYDYKTDELVHDFNDGVITETENQLKIIVTDNVGNSSTFEATFFRK